jgi:hypothetical protein
MIAGERGAGKPASPVRKRPAEKDPAEGISPAAGFTGREAARGSPHSLGMRELAAQPALPVHVQGHLGGSGRRGRVLDQRHLRAPYFSDRSAVRCTGSLGYLIVIPQLSVPGLSTRPVVWCCTVRSGARCDRVLPGVCRALPVPSSRAWGAGGVSGAVVVHASCRCGFRAISTGNADACNAVSLPGAGREREWCALATRHSNEYPAAHLPSASPGLPVGLPARLPVRRTWAAVLFRQPHTKACDAKRDPRGTARFQRIPRSKKIGGHAQPRMPERDNTGENT